jgi:DNA-directed RNA polymerase subunit RPC12/RpoP
MSHEITFNCSKCRKAVRMQSDTAKPHVPCPHCGAMNHIPVKKMKPHRFGIVALAIVLVPLALVGICWGLTMTLGADSLRPEIAQLARGRRNAVTSVKAPAPFVLTYTINVPSGGEGQASMMIRKYFYWFITIKREVPENDVPDLFKWVWR